METAQTGEISWTQTTVTALIGRKARTMMNNRKHKRTWRDTLLTYILLTIAGIILFCIGSEVAHAERGYKAIGGEGFALLLPLFYLIISSTVY